MKETLARNTKSDEGSVDVFALYPSHQYREELFFFPALTVVSLSSPALVRIPTQKGCSPCVLPAGSSQRQPSTPLPCGPAHFVFLLRHHLTRCASSSACALCPYFSWLGLGDIQLPMLVESKCLLSATGGRCREGDAGSTLLPERGILITLIHDQLAGGARSSPRVCVLVIYRQ